MKLSLIILLMLPFCQLKAADKDDAQVIAKGIQCTYLREKSFLDIYEQYAAEKPNAEYVKQVSDSIYSQAFKICDPENTANADKEILKVCSSGCDQFATKGMLGLGGPSKSDIEKCKKMCLDYSDHLGNNYSGATKAVKKYLELNPPVVKKADIVEPAPQAPVAAPVATEAAKKE